MQKMRNELKMKKISKSKGFTLIELLVVITIIGILAGLAVPAITGGLKRANQTRDVNNVRQTGLTLFSDANDNNGVFRSDSAATGSAFGSSTDLFQELLTEGILTSATVLSGTGVQTSDDPTTLLQENVAWDYVKGLKTSSNPNIPLLLSFGTWTKDSISKKAGIDISGFGEGDAMWTNEGAVVYYVGGNAQFIRSQAGGSATAKNVKFTPSDITLGTAIDIVPR